MTTTTVEGPMQEEENRRRRRGDVLPSSLPPRGLSRIESAQYIGISPTKFDQMVADGRMPQPKIIDGRRVWDRRALDTAFAALPDANGRADNDTETDVWGQVAV